MHLSEAVQLTGARERLLRTGGPLEAPLTAVGEPIAAYMGAKSPRPPPRLLPKPAAVSAYLPVIIIAAIWN